MSGFNYTIEYVKGSLNTADSLSRIAQSDTTIETQNESNYINYVGFVNVTQIDYKCIAKHTRIDVVLSKLIDSIQNGTVQSLGDEFSAYRSKSSELSVESGCVLWGYRTIIPQKLQKNVLESLYMSHMGIVKTKSLACTYIYWPKIDRDIELMVKSCKSCQLLHGNQQNRHGSVYTLISPVR